MVPTLKILSRASVFFLTISCAAAQPSLQQPLGHAERTLHLFPPSSTPVSGDADLSMPEDGRKSVGLAAVYSLLLPGMGELYADGFSSGKYFLIAEAALWLTYAGAELYGNNLRDDARTFAAVHAGIIPQGKDDQFYVDIGNFPNLEEYNDKRLRDREVDRLYDPLQGYSWGWDSDAARQSYKDQRLASESAYNARKFIGAVLLINHVASAINAARAAIAHNNALGALLGEIDLRADVIGGYAAPQGIRVTLTRRF